MAKVIGVMGESGSGKTTAMQSLDPQTTFYIDADKKGLNWKGWKNQYSVQNRNYMRSDDPDKIMLTLCKLNLDFSGIAAIMKKSQKEYVPMTEEQKTLMTSFKTIVIDTLNGVMVGQEMRNIHVNGFSKWSDLAEYVWSIVDYCLTMRDDMTVIILCHSETVSDDNGIVFTHIKTNGRKLEKMVLESKMTTVLLAKRINGEYRFITSMDNSTCKSPMGAFSEESIPNNISLVMEALEEF